MRCGVYITTPLGIPGGNVTQEVLGVLSIGNKRVATEMVATIPTSLKKVYVEQGMLSSIETRSPLAIANPHLLHFGPGIYEAIVTDTRNGTTKRKNYIGAAWGATSSVRKRTPKRLKRQVDAGVAKKRFRRACLYDDGTPIEGVSVVWHCLGEDHSGFSRNEVVAVHRQSIPSPFGAWSI